MGSDFLFQAMVYLTAAVVCVPLAQRLKLGSILGYLIAGVLIGPYVLGFVGDEGRDIMQAAQFGVVMMLFLVGLELNPSLFWRMRDAVLGMGSIQVAGTSLLLMAGAWRWDWNGDPPWRSVSPCPCRRLRSSSSRSRSAV